MQDVDYEQVRNYVQGRKENRESQIDDLNFNIQGSTAAVTFNETATRKYAKFGGIGVQIAVDNQVIRVVRPSPKLPAFEAGIQAGDFIIRIDDVEVNISEESGKTFHDYLNRVKGEIGTSVTLTIQRGKGENQKIFDVAITRKEITLRSREKRTAVSQVWTHTDGKWLRLHEQMTPLTGDLMAMISRFIEDVWNKGNLGPLVVCALTR